LSCRITPGTIDYPARQIKPSKGEIYWFLDAGAAKGLIF
jgi:hypothetical protein